MIVFLSSVLVAASLATANDQVTDVVINPETMVYNNMVPGETRAQFVSISNNGSTPVKVFPQVSATEEMAKSISVEIVACEDKWVEDTCLTPSRFVELDVKETGQVKVTVKIDEELTEPFTAEEGKGKLVFTHERDVRPNESNIIIEKSAKDADVEAAAPSGASPRELVTTGASGRELAAAAGGGILTGLGVFLLLFLKRKKKKEDEIEESLS